jgi:hypothetical protein
VTRRGARTAPVRALASAITTVAAVAAATLAAAGPATAATWSVAFPPYADAASVPFAPLYGVSAISASDVWTVGESSGVPLLDAWNGRTWSASTLPTGPCSAFESDCLLTDVSGDSATDVYAVGDGPLVNGGTGWLAIPLAFHWNGRAWSAMTLPSGLPYDAVQHVAAFSSTDAWAVGAGSTASGATTVSAIQWNGTSWDDVSTPYTTDEDLTVSAISGSSPTDIWVAGETVTPGYHNRQFTSVLLHYNGFSWQQESVPDNSGLLDVDALSSTDAWAVAADGAILNWNGSAWSVQTEESGAQQVAALSPTDVWVGGIVSIGHYNGSGWTTSPTPSSVNEIEGAAAVAPRHVWFVGYSFKPGTTEVPVVLSTTSG